MLKTSVALHILQTEPNEYVLTVELVDQGVPALSSSAMLTVYVSDINEEAPVFSMSEYFITVLSTTPTQTSILQVSATDADGGDNIISYDVIDDMTAFPEFSIDSEGVIRNVGPFPSSAEVRTCIICMQET